MRWPWTRREPGAAAVAAADAVAAPAIERPQAAWAALAPLRPTFSPPTLTSAPAGFAAGLATRRPASVSGTLSRQIDVDMPLRSTPTAPPRPGWPSSSRPAGGSASMPLVARPDEPVPWVPRARAGDADGPSPTPASPVRSLVSAPSAGMPLVQLVAAPLPDPPVVDSPAAGPAPAGPDGAPQVEAGHVHPETHRTGAPLAEAAARPTPAPSAPSAAPERSTVPPAPGGTSPERMSLPLQRSAQVPGAPSSGRTEPPIARAPMPVVARARPSESPSTPADTPAHAPGSDSGSPAASAAVAPPGSPAGPAPPTPDLAATDVAATDPPAEVDVAGITALLGHGSPPTLPAPPAPTSPTSDRVSAQRAGESGVGPVRLGLGAPLPSMSMPVVQRVVTTDGVVGAARTGTSGAAAVPDLAAASDPAAASSPGAAGTPPVEDVAPVPGAVAGPRPPDPTALPEPDRSDLPPDGPGADTIQSPSDALAEQPWGAVPPEPVRPADLVGMPLVQRSGATDPDSAAGGATGEPSPQGSRHTGADEGMLARATGPVEQPPSPRTGPPALDATAGLPVAASLTPSVGRLPQLVVAAAPRAGSGPSPQALQRHADRGEPSARPTHPGTSAAPGPLVQRNPTGVHGRWVDRPADPVPATSGDAASTGWPSPALPARVSPPSARGTGALSSSPWPVVAAPVQRLAVLDPPPALTLVAARAPARDLAGVAAGPPTGRVAPLDLPLGVPPRSEAVQRAVEGTVAGPDSGPIHHEVDVVAPGSAQRGIPILQRVDTGASGATDPGAPPAEAVPASGTQVDELADRLYEPLMSRLRADLLLERDRHGFRTDRW